MLWLSSDHTGGPVDPACRRSPTVTSRSARSSTTISHSKYWKDSAIFVVEDDSQDGADHVDGHRAPIQVISPWAAHGKTISTYYSQISMVRTIEQILGAEPLNQKVAAATPMFDAFQSKPDHTPFTAVPNQIPLTENVATPPACGLGHPGRARRRPPHRWPPRHVSDRDGVGAVGAEAALHRPQAQADYAHPEQMNRYTWYQAHNWKTPYPGDPKVYLPEPGAGRVHPGAGDRLTPAASSRTSQQRRPRVAPGPSSFAGVWTFLWRAQASGTLVDVGTVQATLQVGVCVLISIAAVVMLLVVWRDDHRWVDRRRF